MSLWENEVTQFEKASGEIFSPALRIMHLTDMCPQALRQRTKDFAEACFGTCEAENPDNLITYKKLKVDANKVQRRDEHKNKQLNTKTKRT